MSPRQYGGGRVFLRGATWWISYCAPFAGRAKEVRESAGKGATEREAKRFLKKRLREVANHREGLVPWIGPSERRTTVAKLLKLFTEDAEARRIKSLRTVLSRARTIGKRIGSATASALGKPELIRYIRDRRLEGVSDATIDRELETLRGAYALGVEERLVAFVPKIKMLVRRRANARHGFITREQLGAILAGCGPDFRDYLEWFSWTGMRPGETASLEWFSYDETGALPTVRLEARNAKIGVSRMVPIVGPLCAIVARRKARRVDGCPYIFHVDGEKAAPKRTGGLLDRLYDEWFRAVEAAGLPGRDAPKGQRVIPYDLRRSCVRALRAAGVADRISMDITGHKSRATFDSYGPTDLTEIADALRKVGAMAGLLDSDIHSDLHTNEGGADALVQ